MTQKQLLEFEAVYPETLTLADKVALCRQFLARWGAEE